MSGTPQTDDIARGNHVVPTEWAQNLERQRDSLRERYNHLATQCDDAREEARLLKAILDLLKKEAQ